MSIETNQRGQTWVEGPSGTRYAMGPLEPGETLVQRIDAHLVTITRLNQKRHRGDENALLDARLIYALEEFL